MPPDAGDPADPTGDTSFTYPSSEEDQPSTTIVQGVSWLSGSDFRELEPIAHVVDVEALDALFDGDAEPADFYRSSGESTEPKLWVSFEYEGYEVTVDPARVRIEECCGRHGH